MSGQETDNSLGPEYIPALHFAWLTPVYDPLLRWAFPEQRLKRVIVDHAGAPAALLDLGCGTGTLTLMLQCTYPETRIAALDIDRTVLGIALRKEEAARQTGISFIQGRATEIPCADVAFDVVVTSLMVHHLATADKVAALRECLRVLRPNGMLLLADFAAPRTIYARLVSLLVRNLEEVGDNMRGRLPGFLALAGFSEIRALSHIESVLGTLTVYQAVRSADGLNSVVR